MTRSDRLEILFIAYVTALAAGAFGFVDLILLGGDYVKHQASGFAQVQWPMVYVLSLMLLWRHWDAVGTTVATAWPSLVWPSLALVSVIWSIDKGATINSAGRFAFTVLIAMIIATRIELPGLLRIVFAVLFLTVGLSDVLVLAKIPFAMAPDGEAGRGLFFHKNLMGSRAAVLFLVSAVLFLGGRWGSRWSVRWRTLALLGMAAGLAGTVLAHSATSIVIVGAVAGLLPFLAALCFPPATALLLVACGCLLVAVGWVAMRQMGLYPGDLVLAALDRDPTMTGRADLWNAGIANFWSRPVLGTGYDSFWTAGVDWRTQLVINELGDVLHFHNTYIEVAVALGAVGLLALAFYLALLLVTGLRTLAGRREILLVWPVALCILVMVQGSAEKFWFGKHELLQLLLDVSMAQLLLMRADERRFGWFDRSRAVLRQPAGGALTPGQA